MLELEKEFGKNIKIEKFKEKEFEYVSEGKDNDS